MPIQLVARPETTLVLNGGSQPGAADIEALPNGGYVVVWGGRTVADGNRASAVVQIVDSTGALVDMNADPLYTNFFIPHGGGDPNANAGYGAQVSAFADGGFVVAYIDSTYGSQGGATFAQFDADGEFELGPQIATVRLSPSADVVALGNDDYFVSFYTQGSLPYRILHQHVDRAGGEGELPLELDRTDVDSRGHVTSVTRHGDGFITVWTDDDADRVSPEGGQVGVSGAIHDKNGVVIKEFDVNGAGPLAQFIENPNAVVSLEGGGFAVVYKSNDAFAGSTPDSHALVSVFKADGTVIAQDIAVSPEVEGAPTICALPGGGFVVAWNGIRAQMFDAKGGLVGDAFTMVSGFFPSNPTLEVLEDGTIVLGYTEGEQLKTLEFDLALVRDGTEDPDKLKGGGGDDVLNGLGGNDTLIGLGGADELNGGDGADRASYFKSVRVDLADSSRNTGEAKGDTFISIEDLEGGDGDDQLYGDEGVNQLYGGAGADRLEGRGGGDVLNATVSGPDTLVGGEGDDTYIIFHGDKIKIVEAFLEGLDTVRTFADFVLDADAEVETIIAETPGNGDRNIDLTGSDFANRLIGNSFSNRLDGRAGPDTLEGGRGSDVYVIDNPADEIVEIGGKGTGEDRAVLSNLAAFVLDAGVFLETLEVKGDAAVSVTGNETDNEIVGGSGADTLIGGGGFDTLRGAAGKDSLEGGDGADFLFAFDTSRDTLAGGVGDDDYQIRNAGHVFVEAIGGGDDSVETFATLKLSRGVEIERLNAGGNQIIDLTGNEFAQKLVGNEAANRLDGRLGADTMDGRGGGDSYIVDDAGDKVVEARSAEGLDTVVASVDFKLADDVFAEALVAASGAAKIELTGNASDNTLDGNDGVNRLDGGAGADTLEGGGDSDEFVFTKDFGRDRIEDFKHNVDVITIDFKKVDTFDEVMAFAEKSGENVVFTFDGEHRITVEDASMKSFGVNDFAFL